MAQQPNQTNEQTNQQQPAPRQTEREREVIVTDTGGGAGAGTVIAAVLGVIAILIVAWFLFFNGGGDGNVVPDDINADVNVEQPGGGEGGG